MAAEIRLAIDFGTSHTVAVLDPGTGIGQPLLFGDSPLLPSAVHAAPDGRVLTGRDAVRSARMAPEWFEPNPKRRIDDGTVLLGTREFPVAALIAAVLRTVAVEARRVAGGPPAAVALTHPANWGRARSDVLRTAAAEAGLGTVELVPEPEAAALFFTASQVSGPPPDPVVVYDFGGGTFDVCVLTRVEGEYRVRNQAGLDDVGGADLDAALLDHIGHAVSRADAALWQRITRPRDPEARRALRTVYEDVRDAKEQLSRNSSGLIHIPYLDRDFPITRREFEQVAGPIIERTVELTAGTLLGDRDASARPAGVYLVGGSSRVPLVSTLLHRRLGQAPVVTGQPEQVVAQGALHRLDRPVSEAPQAFPAGPWPASPSPTHRVPVVPAARPSGRARLTRALLAAGVAAMLLVLAVVFWPQGPADDGGSGGGKGDAQSAAGEDSGGGTESVKVDVSEEPSIDSFTDDDTDTNIGCYYADVADTGHPAECGDRNANRGFTRQVGHQDECGDRREEDDWRPDVDAMYCETVLFKKRACLDEDFYTLKCDDEASLYVIEDGPHKSKSDCGTGYKGIVRLKATEEYFCYNELDF